MSDKPVKIVYWVDENGVTWHRPDPGMEHIHIGVRCPYCTARLRFNKGIAKDAHIAVIDFESGKYGCDAGYPPHNLPPRFYQMGVRDGAPELRIHDIAIPSALGGWSRKDDND